MAASVPDVRFTLDGHLPTTGQPHRPRVVSEHPADQSRDSTATLPHQFSPWKGTRTMHQLRQCSALSLFTKGVIDQ